MERSYPRPFECVAWARRLSRVDNTPRDGAREFAEVELVQQQVVDCVLGKLAVPVLRCASLIRPRPMSVINLSYAGLDACRPLCKI